MRFRSLAACVCIATLIAALASPLTAEAHAFAAPYTLPVPFWLYAYGSTVALLVSFVFFVLFSSHSLARSAARSVDDKSSKQGFQATFLAPPVIVSILRAACVLMLILTIWSGLVGTQNPFLNFNMTWFWMIFMLVCFYLTAVVGNLYEVLSPWSALCDGFMRLYPGAFSGFLPYPKRVGFVPALFAYMSLIALELFGKALPSGLSIYLIGYSLWCVAGAWVFGKRAWLAHADAFSLIFLFAGLLAPVKWSISKGKVHASWRAPFAGFKGLPRPSLSLTLVILFMLSSTAFDGVHDSMVWNKWFWTKFYPLSQPLVTRLFKDPYGAAASLYYGWQWTCLVLSPFAYLLGYVAVLALGKAIVGSSASLARLIGDFAWSLVPIAFFYNVTHYYTVAIGQSPQIAKLISDPLGKHWDIFGTTSLDIQPLLLNASFVWHSQVGLILAGHVLSVYLAHAQSFKSFDTRASAIFSQLPMLCLMVLLTTSGLWILSLPMAAG